MIIILRKGATKEQISHIHDKIKSIGLKPHVSVGVDRTVIGAVGDESLINEEQLGTLDYVDEVVATSKSYKLVSREFKSQNTVVSVGDAKIGGKQLSVTAGPCAVESKDQILQTAQAVKKSGALILRGGAFKPRTSPHDFQGLGEEGLKYLADAASSVRLPCTTEVMDTRDVALVSEYADILQIGARNMQNYPLLKEVGKSDKPVLLKRGMSADVHEFLLAAEHIMNEGNRNIILCERGIRTFTRFSRNTLDLNAIPFIKQESHLPIIVDPSHGSGKRLFVHPLSKAAIACGADGLLVEVHPNPEEALSDAEQTISTKEFSALMKELGPVAQSVGRSV